MTAPYLVPKSPEVPYPADLNEQGRREWLQRWQFTEAGRAYRRWRRGYGHTLNLQPDGSFRVDGIQPGAYELHIHTRGQAEQVRQVLVPEPAPNQAGVPVDLGTLTPASPGPPDGGP